MRSSIPALLVLSLAAAGCERPAPPPAGLPYPAPETTPGAAVLEIGPVRFSRADIEDRMQSQTPFLRGRLKDPEQRKAFIEQIVRLELFAQEAWAKKLYEDPAVVEDLKKLLVKRLLAKELDAKLQAAGVEDATLESEFAKRKDEFNKPERIRVSRILRKASSPAEIAEARRRLAPVLAKLGKEPKNQHAAFAAAAAEHSEDEATRTAGGDLAFLDRAEAEQRLGADAAAKLFDEAFEVGSLALLETPSGVEIIKKTGRRRAVTRSLSQVKPQLRNQLLRERRAELLETYVDELGKKHNLKVDWQAVSEIPVPGAEGERPTP